jgi:hypothetical protein
MTRQKLDKIKLELAGLRRWRHKALAFQRVAKRLGRKENRKRGKEPMWESDAFPDLFPLAIPDHGGGRDISPGVQRTLLDLMDEDVLRWEEALNNQQNDEVEDEDENEDEDEAYSSEPGEQQDDTG